MALNSDYIKDSVNPKALYSTGSLAKSLYTLLKLARESISDHVDGITSPGISTKEQEFDCKGWTCIFQQIDELRKEPLRSDIHLYFCGMCGQSFMTEENLDSHLEARRQSDKKKADEENKRRKKGETINANRKEEETVTLSIPVTFLVKQLKKQEGKKTAKKEPKNQVKKNRCKQVGKVGKRKTPVNKVIPKSVRKAKFPKPAMQCFTCSECGDVFSKKTSLKIHELKHTKEHTYQCEECDDKPVFHIRKEYIKHSQKVHHSENESCLCDICGQLFKSKHILRQHKKTHIPDRPKPHVCEICKKGFVTSTLLRSHQRIHSGDTPFVCETCGKGFKWKSSLRSHMERHSDKVYSCDICGQRLTDKSNVSKHMQIHSGSTPFSCDICGKQFRLKQSLSVHLETHAEEQKHFCSICGKGFKTKGSTLAHEQIHKEDRQNYMCEQCGKSFVRKKTLRQHQLVHSGENLKCLKCYLDFGSRKEKREHMTVVHKWEVAAMKVHKCDHCDKTFETKAYLRSHSQVHNKDTIYKCTKCPKSYNRQDSFKAHQRLHMAEENRIQYRCTICNKRFKDLKYVQGHIRSFHSSNLTKTNQKYEGLYEIVRKDQALPETSAQSQSSPNVEAKNSIHTLRIAVEPEQATEDLEYFEYHIL